MANNEVNHEQIIEAGVDTETSLTSEKAQLPEVLSEEQVQVQSDDEVDGEDYAEEDIGTAALLKHTVEEDDDDDDAEDEGYLPKEKDESDEDDGQEWTPEPSPTIDDIVEDTGNLNLPVLKDNFKGPEQGATQVSDNGQSASNGAAGTKRSRDADDDAEDADAEDESEKKKVKA